MKKGILIGLLGAGVLAAGLLHFSGKNHVYSALYHNFADIDDNLIFEERIIKAGTAQPWPQAADYNKKPIPDKLSDLLKKLETVALVVIQNDSLRHEAYWDGYGPESRSNSFSVAKSYVSTLVGIALKEGLIKSIDQPVADFLPEFKEGKKQNITLRHLLMMSSGLNWDESYSNPLSMTTEAYYGHDLRKLISRLQVAEAPGKRWQYKSGDTQILGFVVEAATGKSLSDYATEKLWKRTGAEQDAEWSIDHEGGDEKAYCCLFSNARDFARIGQLYLNRGIWKGDTILSPEYVNEATTPNRLPDLEGKASEWYGLQWWILPEETGEQGFYARGILGQYVIVVPEKRLVIVRLGKKRGEKAGNHLQEVIELTKGISAQY